MGVIGWGLDTRKGSRPCKYLLIIKLSRKRASERATAGAREREGEIERRREGEKEREGGREEGREGGREGANQKEEGESRRRRAFEYMCRFFYYYFQIN